MSHADAQEYNEKAAEFTKNGWVEHLAPNHYSLCIPKDGLPPNIEGNEEFHDFHKLVSVITEAVRKGYSPTYLAHLIDTVSGGQ